MGRELRASALHAQIKAAITRRRRTAQLRRPHQEGPRRRSPPTSSPTATGPCSSCSAARFRLRLYKHLKLATTYPIAVGQVGLETPAGHYSIANKAVNPAWHVPNSAWAGDLAGKVIPGGTRRTRSRPAGWASTTASASTAPSDDASIGSNASHGCIRMHVADVEKLYDQVPVGTAGLHRLEGASEASRRPDLLDRDLLPAALEKQGMVVGVSKHQRADEDAPLLLVAAPRTTASRRRRSPWIRSHGRGGSPSGSAMPGRDQLLAAWRPDPWPCR